MYDHSSARCTNNGENGIQTVVILERIATTLVVVITQALEREALVVGVKVAVAAIAGVDSSSPRTTPGLQVSNGLGQGCSGSFLLVRTQLLHGPGPIISC